MRTIVVYGTKQRQIRTVCHNRDLVTTSTWRDPESAENYIDLRWHLWLGDCRWSTGRNQVRPRISAFNLEDWDFCSQTWTRLLDAVRRCILRATDFVTFDKDLKVQNPFRPRWLWSRHSNKFFRVSHTRTPKTLHVTPPTNTLSNGSSNWFPGSLISIRFYYRTMTTYILHKYKKVRLRLHAHGPIPEFNCLILLPCLRSFFGHFYFGVSANNIASICIAGGYRSHLEGSAGEPYSNRQLSAG